MALPANLTTNEVKNAAGTEVEYLFLQNLLRGKEFAKSGELPNLPHRLRISHQVSGTGIKTLRRSVVRFERTIVGVDTLATRHKVVAQLTIEFPEGNVSAVTELQEAIANLLSFCATTGAATTVLFDGTGYGAAALINGTL